MCGSKRSGRRGGGRETESGGRMEIEGEGWEMHMERGSRSKKMKRDTGEARESERPGEIYM